MADSVSPADGPVTVTGSAGYIGSHIVKALVNKGYQVRACVRDATNIANTAHLLAMNSSGPGRVFLYTCDMNEPNVYDKVFKGCRAVFHAAAEMGNLEGSTPQKVYDGGLLTTRMVMDSVKKSIFSEASDLHKFVRRRRSSLRRRPSVHGKFLGRHEPSNAS